MCPFKKESVLVFFNILYVLLITGISRVKYQTLKYWISHKAGTQNCQNQSFLMLNDMLSYGPGQCHGDLWQFVFKQL